MSISSDIIQRDIPIERLRYIANRPHADDGLCIVSAEDLNKLLDLVEAFDKWKAQKTAPYFDPNSWFDLIDARGALDAGLHVKDQ